MMESWMTDFEEAMALVLSEGLATIDKLTDEEIERIMNA
jgi:hypothetical protein